MKGKIFSGIDGLPNGRASDQIVPGCLVLEGGAFRAVYGEGVLDALMEAGINMACTVGVSAGAMNGANYVSGQIGRSARINLRYRHDSRYISIRRSRQNGGIVSFDFVLKHVPNDPFDLDRFFDPQRRFVAVATDLNTGETAYFEQTSCSDIFKAIQASASMPYVSRMVELDGVPYLDGGCSTKIPYRWALEQGYDKIVIVRTRPDTFRYPVKKGGDALPRHFYRSYPAFAEKLATSNERYDMECDEIDRLRAQGRVFVFSPSQPTSVGRLERDMEKLGAWYHLGYQDGKNGIDDLRRYLAG